MFVIAHCLSPGIRAHHRYAYCAKHKNEYVNLFKAHIKFHRSILKNVVFRKTDRRAKTTCPVYLALLTRASICDFLSVAASCASLTRLTKRSSTIILSTLCPQCVRELKRYTTLHISWSSFPIGTPIPTSPSISAIKVSSLGTSSIALATADLEA